MAMSNWYLRRDTDKMPGDSPAYEEVDASQWFGPYVDSGPRDGRVLLSIP